MNYYELSEKKKRAVRQYFLDFVFTRKSYKVVTATHLEGGYNPKTRRLSGAKFDVVLRLDMFFQDNYAKLIQENKQVFLDLAKAERRTWTFSEDTVFLTDQGNVEGKVVSEVTGDNLIDFWFEDGSLFLEVMCYGF